MKTLNFDIFEVYQLTIDEMISVRGGDAAGEGEPIPSPVTPPVKI